MTAGGLRGLLSAAQRQRLADLGIIEFEDGTTSDVDHDVVIERRVREGETGLLRA